MCVQEEERGEKNKVLQITIKVGERKNKLHPHPHEYFFAAAVAAQCCTEF